MGRARDLLGAVLLRVRETFRRGTVERELDDEVRFHIELETRAGIDRGLTAEAARREALVKFGGVERFKEEARDARGLAPLEDLGRDVRHAGRLLRKSPGFAAAAVLTLALGIGANTAIFSVVDAVLLSESPFPEPDRLVMVWETDRASDTHHEPASWPDVVDFDERSRTLSEIGAVVGQDFTLGGDGEPERVTGLAVTPNLFQLLGVRPIAGRLFREDEGDFAAGPVVLLGEEFWRGRYGGDPGVVGRPITLNERTGIIVGVAPAAADLGIRQVHERADYAPSFSGDEVDVWQAFRPTADAFPRETHPFLTLGRLAPGVALAAAQEELASIAADLEEAYPENAARGVNLEPYSDVVFGPVRPALLVLLGAVALVLLVTCANVANLLLARTTARSREVAVRRALGAGSGRIRRQFLVESLVLTVLGTAVGVALAFAGLEALVALAPSDIPRLAEAEVDGRVLAFTAGVAGIVALLFGLLPALQTRRMDIHEALQAQPGRRVSEGRAARGFRSALVVAEVALAVMLVIGAGLLLRSFWRLQAVDPGFRAAGVLKAEYQLPGTRYPRDFSRWPDIPEINGLHVRFLDAVRSIPGVEAATIAGGHPLDPGFTNSFQIIGREAESADFPEIRVRFISAGYLEAVGGELLEGRTVSDADDARSTPVVVINRTAAERYFAEGSPLGQQIRFWGTNRTIVGVIGDERFKGIDQATDPAVYAPLLQNPQQVATLLVRTVGAPLSLALEIRRRLSELDPQLALFGIEPLQATLSGTLSKPRFTATLLLLFAAVALLLALVGVHGVLSYAVARRAPEVGIRMALGASRGEVIRSVLGEGLALAGIGTALGLAGAFLANRLLASLVFGITTTDAGTFVAVPAAVLAVAAVASLAPALRASRQDPIEALRAE
ncbi:MAG: ABC transporter permease [Gemmatimonadetes bacterium]|nr:ABC transporter permease [Gemmatimonadota bacterium]